MKLAEWIAGVPGPTRCSLVLGSGDYTVDELRAALAVDSGQRDMTARELAAEFGHSRDWWQDRARAGLLPGAYQSGARGRWYIPRSSATVFLRERRERGAKKTKRKPWKGAAQPGIGRPAAVQEGALVGSGSSAVGWRAADLAGPGEDEG